MKKGCLVGGGILAIIVIIALIVGLWAMNIYNKIIPMDEGVKSQWSNVENTYQKRLDLVDNLVGTVKGAANFEKETLTDVIEARSKATATTIDPTNLTPEKIAQFQQAQEGLSGALSRLMLVVERYPELKANQNFLNLQTSLESIEAEVLFERRKYNQTAKEYNSYVRSAPQSIIANLFDFDEKGYFEAQAGAENAPKVDFSNE